MYIFYAFCLLFLPIITRSIQVFKNKTESSLISFVYVISCFSLIFSPLLALDVLHYDVCLILSWIIFACTIFILIYHLSYHTYKFIKLNSITKYKETLRYLFWTNLIPFVFFFIFILSVLFISIKFDDQFGFTNISINYRNNIFSFDGYSHLGYWYQITSGYFVNSAMGFNSIISMYNYVWTLIPIFLIFYGTNDLLLSFFKRNEKKKYFIASFSIMLVLYILSYSFIWAYGSGNVLLQASVLFLLIYFLKIKDNLAFVWLTSLFLIFFSPTGILLSVALIIVSFMYVVLFKNVKNLFYWLGYFIFLCGPILSIYLWNVHYLYLLLILVSLFYILIFFIFSNHYNFLFFNINFLQTYHKYNFVKSTENGFFSWFFKKINFAYWTIALMVFCTILLFVLYLTILKSPFIYSGLNIIAFLINLGLCIALAYTLVKKNEFNKALFLLYFLTFACFIVSLLLFFSFKGNNSIWRISYLCIGFEEPFYYLAIFAITIYISIISKINFTYKKKDKTTKTSVLKVLFHPSQITFFSAWTIIAICSIVYDDISMSTYPISLNSNITQAKSYFDKQELNELDLIKANIVSKNIISDAPVFTYLYGAINANVYLLQNASNTDALNTYFENFRISDNISPIEPWKLSMFNFEDSILQYAWNYFHSSNYSLSEELSILYKNTNNKNIKNFMDNTFYGSNYINNFIDIIKTANKYSNAKLSYLIFSSNTPYFSTYEKLIFPYLLTIGYHAILSKNNESNINHYQINSNEPYLYILEK